jgi:hypothetical protein
MARRYRRDGKGRFAGGSGGSSGGGGAKKLTKAQRQKRRLHKRVMFAKKHGGKVVAASAGVIALSIISGGPTRAVIRNGKARKASAAEHQSAYNRVNGGAGKRKPFSKTRSYKITSLK